MPKTHTVKIGSLTRELPIIEVSSNTSIALFNSISDTEIIVEAAKELSKIMPMDIEVLVTPEAKSIPLVFELSKITKIPYIVVRKTKKPYMGNALETTVVSITTNKEQSLFIDEKDLSIIKNKKVAIIDDVVSTGATVEAVLNLLNQSEAKVVSTIAIFTEGDKEKWKDVISLGHLPIFS